jgi:UDP-N-acetylglucosamine:LPS N-acetylglucosamine transferase
VTPEGLVGELRRLLDDAQERERLSAAIAQFARPDAAMELAKLIYDVGGAGERGGMKTEQGEGN